MGEKVKEVLDSMSPGVLIPVKEFVPTTVRTTYEGKFKAEFLAGYLQEKKTVFMSKLLEAAIDEAWEKFEKDFPEGTLENYCEEFNRNVG